MANLGTFAGKLKDIYNIEKKNPFLNKSIL